MANTFKVGDLEVIAVSDGSVTFPATAYFAGTTPEQWEPHERWTDHAGNLVFPFGCFLVRSGDTRVLIDTGLGPIHSDTWNGGALLGDLASAGVKPEDIDIVFITHLHADHCGTAALNVDGVMQPTFPRASYRWTSAEQAHWSGDLKKGTVARRDIFAAVAPRWRAADGGISLAPGIDVYAMPGHTPGHAGVVLSSGDARAFVLGDGISCPVQLEEAEWSGLGDLDPTLARKNQEALAKEIEGNGALVGTSHFPGLTFGRVLSGEGRRYWQPVGS
jgi:glyoxylase-like metal-dependent hydrolase (beta-lactamase superfamily II)